MCREAYDRGSELLNAATPTGPFGLLSKKSFSFKRGEPAPVGASPRKSRRCLACDGALAPQSSFDA
jgi:hypothetical protein